MGLLVIINYSNQNQQPQVTSNPTTLGVGQDVKIKGQITEHSTDCAMDGLCYFKLQDYSQIIIYNYGLSTAEGFRGCPHDPLSGSLGNGVEVEVFGKVINEGEISVCHSESYYIRPAL